jgi:hypothetical protein
MRRAFAAFAVGLVACASGVRADTGLEALMRVQGAQFFAAAMPADASGPDVAQVKLATNTVFAGYFDKPLSGALAPEATAAAIGLRGDRGYWIVPAGVPGVDAPTFPTFAATLAFSPSLPDGKYELVVRAVDAAGRFGKENVSPLTTTPAGVPAGTLVVSLSWDTEVDLDLHLVIPSGLEIYNRNISSYQPLPGQPADPAAIAAAGELDFDSNAACVIDGRRLENVSWKQAPPSGHYVARVDTFSLCGQVAASWHAVAASSGNVLASAQGQSFASDAQLSHGLGAGVLAFEFDVP